MGTRQSLQVSVLTDKATLFKGEADAVFVPTSGGELAIMPFHIPLITLIAKGTVAIAVGKARTIIATVEQGVAYVGENEVSVLVTGAVAPAKPVGENDYLTLPS